MCIMASPVKSVSGTKIFVGADSTASRQLTIYSMSVQLQGSQNAMILPVPISMESADSIEMGDMTQNPDFFDPLTEAFEERSRSMAMNSKGILSVQKVGSYDVSIVPSVEDVKRLSASFKLSSDTENVLRAHCPLGYAFVVAQLNQSGPFHPLAYTAPLIGRRLFIPTRHAHGEAPGEKPSWDHQIFYQGNIPPDVMPSNVYKTAHQHVIDGRYAETVTQMIRNRAIPIVAPYILDRPSLTCIKANGSLSNIDITVSA